MSGTSQGVRVLARVIKRTYSSQRAESIEAALMTTPLPTGP